MVTIPDRSILKFLTLFNSAVLATLLFFHGEANVLMADSMGFQDAAGNFTITNPLSVQSSSSSVVTPSQNPSFSLTSAGYFLVNGTTNGASAAVRASGSEPVAIPASGAGLVPPSGNAGNLDFSGESEGGLAGKSDFSDEPGSGSGSSTGNSDAGDSKSSAGSNSNGFVGSNSNASTSLVNLGTDTGSIQSLATDPLADPTPVPEPGSLWLVLAGLAIVGARRYVVQRD